MRSAPAASASATCWPSRAKSAARIEGASLIGCCRLSATRCPSGGLLVSLFYPALTMSIPRNECVRRAVVGQFWLGLAFQLGRDAVGEDFAQFDSPLVERIDVPDRALHENAVLVKGDNLAEGRGGQSIEQKGV